MSWSNYWTRAENRSLFAESDTQELESSELNPIGCPSSAAVRLSGDSLQHLDVLNLLLGNHVSEIPSD